MATRSVPQPPFSAELLADLHADNVEPDLAARLWPVVRADADAVRYLRELDEVTARVRALGIEDQILHPMPRDVADRLTAFVESLGAVPGAVPEAVRNSSAPVEIGAGNGHGDRDSIVDGAGEEPTQRLTGAPAAHPFGIVGADSTNGRAGPVDGPTERITAPTPLRPRRRPVLAWLGAAAAAFVLLAGIGVGLGLRGSGDDGPPPIAQPSASSTTPGDSLDATAALAALGRHEVEGPLADSAALESCVEAAGLDRPVLGSMNFTYRGSEAVLILLAGPASPKITALVVGPECSVDDPQVLDITDIG